MKKFPKTLYITRENEDRSDDEYLQPREALDDAAEIGVERRVAVYELKEVVILTTEVRTKSKTKQ